VITYLLWRQNGRPADVTKWVRQRHGIKTKHYERLTKYQLGCVRLAIAVRSAAWVLGAVRTGWKGAEFNGSPGMRAYTILGELWDREALDTLGEPTRRLLQRTRNEGRPGQQAAAAAAVAMVGGDANGGNSDVSGEDDDSDGAEAKHEEAPEDAQHQPLRQGGEDADGADDDDEVWRVYPYNPLDDEDEDEDEE